MLRTHLVSPHPHPLLVALRLHRQLLPPCDQSFLRDLIHSLDDGELLESPHQLLRFLEHLVCLGHAEVASRVDDPLGYFWIFSIDSDFLPLPDVEVVALRDQE